MAISRLLGFSQLSAASMGRELCQDFVYSKAMLANPVSAGYQKTYVIYPVLIQKSARDSFIMMFQ